MMLRSPGLFGGSDSPATFSMCGPPNIQAELLPPASTLPRPLLSECGTHQTVQARFSPWLAGKSHDFFLSPPLRSEAKYITLGLKMSKRDADAWYECVILSSEQHLSTGRRQN